METALTDVREKNKLNDAFVSATDIITKDYLSEISGYSVKRMPRKLSGIDICELTRLYRFRRLVTDKDENMLDKLVTVLNAAYSCNATVISIIKGNGSYTDYYLGIVSKDTEQEKYDVTTQGEVFKSVLTGNFSGLEIENLKNDQIDKICEDILNNDNITSVSGITSLRSEKNKSIESYVQGMEHLIDSMQNRNYTLLIIGDPVSSSKLAVTRNGYQELYSQLSPYLNTTFTFNESESVSLSQSHTEGVSESLTQSTSKTQSYSESNGWSTSDSQGTSVTKNPAAAVGAVAGALAAGATILSGGLAAPIAYCASGAVTSMASYILPPKQESEQHSSGKSGSTSTGTSETSGKSESRGSNTSDTESSSESSSNGRSLQFSGENKTVRSLLEKIDKQLARLEKCESFGAFNYAAYVISSDPQTNTAVAAGYNALMRGEGSSVHPSYINEWDSDSPCFDEIKKYLGCFSHPVFCKPESDITVTPASLIDSNEMAISIGIPKKSVAGLPVYEIASFGRNVYRTTENRKGEDIVSLGKVFHMAVEEKTAVELELKSLAMHTFITGSTGSGKSNTVYHLLSEIKNKNVNFMVIEPAKGEYKNIFGNDCDVSVYGTNPLLMPLLKIDPFSFPKGIHVLEHIDRLVEIFNVCWPMYAAMPAVLKDAVEKSYMDCGWDMTFSKNEFGDDIYPCFSDVARNVKTIIDSSEYDAENKGAYKGSLLTRLRSLTNGINGTLFSSDELTGRQLFDENVIVDLSRVGSAETKSLIMGMLVLKLQEYRMTQSSMNSALRHITVLEEAHNLLKRTASDQSADSANLAGKSVEMISNAIAEMRTYGEGFIIADQAPGLLDMAVIRNTNTKIILRLPDYDDRQLVGKAANLNGSQIDELAKLPCGVAAVYQNEWVQPVLCKVEQFDAEQSIYICPELTDKADSDLSIEKSKIAEYLSCGTKLGREAVFGEINNDLKKMKLHSSTRVRIMKLLLDPPKEPRMTRLAPIMSELFPEVRNRVKAVYEESRECAEWTSAAESALRETIGKDIAEQVRRDIVQSIITDYIYLELGKREELEKWSIEGGLI